MLVVAVVVVGVDEEPVERVVVAVPVPVARVVVVVGFLVLVAPDSVGSTSLVSVSEPASVELSDGGSSVGAASVCVLVEPIHS